MNLSLEILQISKLLAISWCTYFEDCKPLYYINGLGNGLLADSTKLSSAPMLTYSKPHRWCCHCLPPGLLHVPAHLSLFHTVMFLLNWCLHGRFFHAHLFGYTINFKVFAIWAFSLKNYCSFKVKPNCLHVYVQKRYPQTPAEICRDMSTCICDVFRAVAMRKNIHVTGLDLLKP